MVQTVRPRDENELSQVVRALADAKMPAEIKGAGSKRAAGRPLNCQAIVETIGLTGLTLYEPTELVMSARAGTPLREIEAMLSSRNQMLPFEPIDLGPVTGTVAGAQTVGGVFATNASGPRRIASGGSRDHVLGMRAVNGRGEVFKSGGRVLKNVTGYDVARMLNGSWGTLAVMTEITFKVMPRPQETETLVWPGLTEEIAIEAMCAALATPYEVSGTIHVGAALTPRLELVGLAREAVPLTAMRIENFSTSVAYRSGRLAEALKIYGAPFRLGHAASLQFWAEVGRLSVFCRRPGEEARQLWRISTAPRQAAKVLSAIRRNTAAEVMLDASGGIIWLEVPASADAGGADIRRILASFGGHATLVAADRDVRETVEVFQPMTPVVAQLSVGLKDAFDPVRILNPGRMHAGL